jgi:capsular exopolysaccharide synthesis family protein
MSKYFNETIKARSGALATGELKQAAVQDYQEVAVAKGPVVDLGAPGLERCRKLEIPLGGLLRAQFQGSDLLDAAEESYRALRTRLLKLMSVNGMRSVVITSAEQGEGKTMTSLNLALCCAQLHDLRVLLIDGDIRSRGLTRTLGSPAGPGLAEILSGECRPEQAVFSTDLANLQVIGSGSPSTPPAELLASSRLHELISWGNESFKLIIVDSPPVVNLSDVELITAACDGVLTVVRARRTGREVLKKCVSRLDAKKVLGVVYNAAAGSSNRYNYAYSAPKEK